MIYPQHQFSCPSLEKKGSGIRILKAEHISTLPEAEF